MLAKLVSFHRRTRRSHNAEDDDEEEEDQSLGFSVNPTSLCRDFFIHPHNRSLSLTLSFFSSLLIVYNFD